MVCVTNLVFFSDDAESGDVTSICWRGVAESGVSVLSTMGVNLEDWCLSVSVESGGIVFVDVFFLDRELLMQVIFISIIVFCHLGVLNYI